MCRTILIAEDDQDIVQLITLYLENEGLTVLSANNGTAAYELVKKEHIDLAILDIMMPGLNGYELTKAIRTSSNIPIMILSAKNLDADKILGLDMGADDYMTKPFNPLEIVARVKALLRRFYDLGAGSEKGGSETLHVNELELNTRTMTLTKNGKAIDLTPTEYKILVQLMQSPGRVFTKMQLYESIVGSYFESDDNTMMVHISNLRDKIEDDPRKPTYIKTVRGLGYKIEG